ncbi:MAG: outer membrane protein assembly factor BamA [Desulfovibrio sp.]|jgi:outer membrane protein insertion porin family|nr:outer membrane protein assembly factor BamA [Desulfovibrio sp.]
MNKSAERIQKIFALLAFTAALGLCGSAATMAYAAAAAPATRILILPFQIHADSARPQLESSFPKMLGERIGAAGVAVVPHEHMLRLVKSRNPDSFDIAAVRSLLSGAGATHAVYGSVHQSSASLSIDARLISAGASLAPKPLFVEQVASAAGMGNALDALAGSVVAELPSARASRVAASAGNGIAGVEVRGTNVLDPDVVHMRISTRKGDHPDAAAIDQEVKRIWDLGYFSDVQVDLQQRPEGIFLVYTVVEKPRVEHIAVEGTKDLDADDIIAVMNTKAGSILNESLLADDIVKILELYRKNGFYLAKIDHRIDGRQGGASAALVIVVDEGKKLYIKRVDIGGANQLKAGEVKDQLLLSERSIISWITGTGVLKEELIERDSAAIASYYLDRGFMDITVAAPKISYEDDGIAILFPIHEGPRYTIGSVKFSGDLIDTDERLRSVVASEALAQKKEYFNLSVLQSDAKALTEYYADYGYAFADVNPQPRKRDDASNVVDLDFIIQKNNKVYVRRVLVEGNSKTRDNVILREMRLTDGEQFEGSKLHRSIERLDKLGYFEMAEAELVPTQNAEEVDLKVKIKERPTGALMAGVGYSTFSSVGVSGTLMERNLWGRGYAVSLQAAFTGLRDAYTFSFTNPRVNDTPLAMGTDLYHWRDDYIDFTKKTTGGVLRFSYPIGEYTSLGWGYRLDQYEIYDVHVNASQLIRDYADGTRYTSAALARIIRDSTNRERPTSGTINAMGVEYGGGLLRGNDDFITVDAEHQTYFELKPEHVLHARIKGSAIFENGSRRVPVFERFWMGGMQSVRGYNSRDIVPRDPNTGDRIGGTRMAFANLEYIWSINNEFGLSLVPFFDIGFNIDANHDYTWSKEILKSTGMELRWRSPMGDLRFSYGIPFDEDRKGNKSSGRFEFSMGQSF